MTTAGVLTSWSNKKAFYMIANGPSFEYQYLKIVPKDRDVNPGTGTMTQPFGKPAAVNSYADYMAPMQLKFYHYSTETSGVNKLFYVAQGQTTSNAVLGGATGLSWIYPGRFGLWIKYSGGNLYRLSDTGGLEQTVTPANLGGGTNDISSLPTYCGQTAGDFAFVSGAGQVCIYRPVSSPGAAPERLVVTNGYPSQTGYHSDSLKYSPKHNRLYWVGNITGGVSRVMTCVPGGSVSVLTTPNPPKSFGRSFNIYQGDPIFFGQDDKLYRATDGVTFSLWLNANTITDSGSLNYLETDNLSIYFSAIDNGSGDTCFYQIDTNLAGIRYPNMYTAEIYPRDLVAGLIV